MKNKATLRKRGFNNFRYYPSFQKLVSNIISNGSTFDDYQSHGFMPCTKDAVSAHQSAFEASRKITGDYKLRTRYGYPIDINDRLLFIDNIVETIKKENMLKVESFVDKDGRREYLDLMCSQGAYIGPAPSNPEKDNTLIFKAALSTAELTNIADLVFDDLIEDDNIHADVIIKGSKKENNFYVNPIEAKDALIFVTVGDVISEISIKEASSSTSTVISTSTDLNDGLKLWQHDISLAKDVKKYFYVSFY